MVCYSEPVSQVPWHMPSSGGSIGFIYIARSHIGSIHGRCLVAGSPKVSRTRRLLVVLFGQPAFWATFFFYGVVDIGPTTTYRDSLLALIHILK